MTRKLSHYSLGKRREERSMPPNEFPGKKHRTIREKLILAGAASAIIYCAVSLGRTIYQTGAYEDKLQQAKTAKDVAIVQHREVAREHEQLQDPDYLTGVARRDYRYSKPGEIVFILKDEGKQIKGFEQANSEEEAAQSEEE